MPPAARLRAAPRAPEFHTRRSPPLRFARTPAATAASPACAPRARHWPAKTVRRWAAAPPPAVPCPRPLPHTLLPAPSDHPHRVVPTGFRLAQYDLALRRLLRLSELAIGDNYGAAIPAPPRSALRASQGPSICRAATYLAMVSWRYKGPRWKLQRSGSTWQRMCSRCAVRIAAGEW